MSGSLKLRGGVVLLALVFSLVSLAPTFFGNSLPGWWTGMFDPIHLGLDLQGGMHLVLGVDVDKAVESRLDSAVDQVESLLNEKEVIFKRVERLPGDRLTVTVYDAQSGDAVDELMKENFPGFEPMTLPDEGGYIQKNYRLSDKETAYIRVV